jgi:hypothetical protein
MVLMAKKPQRIYTWHDSISGELAAAKGYARQQREAAKAREAARPRVHVIDRGPQPPGYDGIVNGIWRRYVEVFEWPETPAPSAPRKSAMPSRADLDRYVTVDGEIRSRPRHRFDPAG